jgi:hypothetical protein
MSGFTEPRASGASERPGRQSLVFSWGACVDRLPLVRRIAQDIASSHERLSQLGPEIVRLDRQRRNLDWSGRSRRYQLQEDCLTVERELADLQAELERLGLKLLDGPSGLVGFPTIVNDRRAYFSWQPGEEGILFWNYHGDMVRNTVPTQWTKPQPQQRERPRKGGRSRP